MCTILVVKSIYEYNESKDPSILVFEADERFVLIKDPDHDTDWYYVINHKGQIGYVPHSYVAFEENLANEELVKLIDQIANNLDLNERNKILTDRQRKHAQIKLAQLRCEITQSLVKDKTPKNAAGELTAIEENNLEEEEEGESKACPNCQRKNILEENINENLISNLIENVKLDANMGEEKAIIVTSSVIRTLAENIPAWSAECQKMLVIMDKYEQEKVNSENVYSSKLKCIFKRLWYCKDDSQQRNWPVYEDEHMISSYLDELTNLLTETDKNYLENEICSNGFENVNNLVAYFQMETRRSLRIKLMDIFIYLIKFYGNRVTPEFFLQTVLPMELAGEMQNHLADSDRWIKVSNLFTLIFSSGHKPPFSIYEHLNENFFSKQFDLIEGFDINGQVIECDIQPEYIISPILSFNLHFVENVGENVIFKALRKRTNASHFTENLISYLNWEEDIILTSCAYVRPQTTEPSGSSNAIPNSVLKFLNEMFLEKIVSALFYYNDVRVIIDIIINQLNNLPVGDHRIKNYLTLTLNIMNNTQYVEEPHKACELKKCLTSIQHHEFSNVEDVSLAQHIIDNFNETFNYANQL